MKNFKKSTLNKNAKKKDYTKELFPLAPLLDV